MSKETVAILERKLAKSEEMNAYYRNQIRELNLLIEDVRAQSEEYRMEAQRLGDMLVA